jgi:SHS family lactate transporter-like MFS transporter
MANPQDNSRTEEKMSVSRYLATRVTTLVPPMNKAPNPFKALMLLNKQQWLFFLVSGTLLQSRYARRHAN